MDQKDPVMEAPAVKRSGVIARRSRAAALAAAATVTLGLAGCSTMSPATIATPYQAADGTNGTIPGSGVKLSNFVVVSSGKGEPGQVVGAVSNESATPVTITMQTAVGSDSTAPFSQTKISVKAHDLTQVGPSGVQIVVPDTPVEPGALMEISANSESSGGITLTVPVVAASGYYSGYTVAPTPSASLSPDTSAEATPSGEPTETPTSSKKKSKKSTDEAGTEATPTGTSSDT